MVTIPGETPSRIPLEEPMDAIAGTLLVQVPPEVASLSVIDEPAQTVLGPVIWPDACNALKAIIITKKTDLNTLIND
jgi:hypothetical protein